MASIWQERRGCGPSKEMKQWAVTRSQANYNKDPNEGKGRRVSAMDWAKVCLPKIHMLNLTPIVAVLGDRVFGRLLGHEGGVLTIGLVPLPGERLESLLPLGPFMWGSGSKLRGQAVCQLRRGHLADTSWSAPWSCTSQPSKMWEINGYCLNHPKLLYFVVAPKLSFPN